MKPIGRVNAVHYYWKEICDGWHFVNRDDLSVIAEKMPPHTEEDMHYHRHSRQFFYILSGCATMNFSDRTETVNAGEGIEIAPGESHQMANKTDDDLEFLVVSMPKSHGDKVVVQKS